VGNGLRGNGLSEVTDRAILLTTTYKLDGDAKREWKKQCLALSVIPRTEEGNMKYFRDIESAGSTSTNWKKIFSRHWCTRTCCNPGLRIVSKRLGKHSVFV
jgi:hypothetical protein